MFRASACFVFILCILAIAVFTAYVLVQTAGINGLAGWIAGLGVFALILTVSVMLLASINDRINK